MKCKIFFGKGFLGRFASKRCYRVDLFEVSLNEYSFLFGFSYITLFTVIGNYITGVSAFTTRPCA